MKLDRGVLVAAIVVFGALSLLVALPLAQYVLLALLLGYVLHPVQKRLAPRVGPRISAGALITATALVILIPLGAVITVATQQALEVYRATRAGRLGIETVERFLREQLGVAIDVSRVVSGVNPNELVGVVERGGGTALFGSLMNVFGGLSNAVLGLTVLVFLTYYLLTDGTASLRWLRGVTPLSADVWEELVERVDQLVWAVIVGNVAVAVVQGVLTGIGLVLIGFPSAVFWTVVTVVLGLLPLIGASIVWVPAAAYLLLVGRPVAAVLLFAYGASIVSLSDNYLRPVIGGREAGLNPGLFVLGISGGLFVFGFLGVFFGPVVLGTLKVFVELFARERPPAHDASDDRPASAVDTSAGERARRAS
ncbi:AI-2E family transporter [Halococcus sediminicola]|uniref:AI-2E family transporter n=1 Tax=Halococcus sediminicola TaxID=1264579 RepID=UPI00067984FC|nr:AI-2E family transporter [Halococcus sediminicola]